MTVSSPQTDPALLVHALLDGELDPANALATEHLMAADPALAAEYSRLKALQTVLRERPLRKPLPGGLRARVEMAVGIRRARSRPSWLGLVASIIVTVMITSSITWFVRGPDQVNSVRDSVLAGHIRALMAPQPIDVASSDYSATIRMRTARQSR